MKYTFEAGQYDKTLASIIVINNSEFNIAIAFFNDGGLRTIVCQPRLPIDKLLEAYLFKERYDQSSLLVIFWRKRLRMRVLDALHVGFIVRLLNGLSLAIYLNFSIFRVIHSCYNYALVS